jgi:hypothetical protein
MALQHLGMHHARPRAAGSKPSFPMISAAAASVCFAFLTGHSFGEVKGTVETPWRKIPGLLAFCPWMGALQCGLLTDIHPPGA